MRAASLHHTPPGRCSPIRKALAEQVVHLRERQAPGDRGSGEHAARPAWPDPARAGQYLLVAAHPLEDALAVHLAKWITEQFQSCTIGVTEVERAANLLIR